jgi:hypothetical protein
MCKLVAALNADPNDREPLCQILSAVRCALPAELKPYAAPDFDASDHVSWLFSFMDNLISLGFKEHQTLPNILKHDDHTPPAQVAAAARINPHTANPKPRHKAGNMVNPDGCRHCEQCGLVRNNHLSRDCHFNTASPSSGSILSKYKLPDAQATTSRASIHTALATATPSKTHFADKLVLDNAATASIVNNIALLDNVTSDTHATFTAANGDPIALQGSRTLRIPLEGNTFATLTAHLAEQAPFNLISLSQLLQPCSPNRYRRPVSARRRQDRAPHP